MYFSKLQLHGEHRSYKKFISFVGQNSEGSIYSKWSRISFPEQIVKGFQE